MLLLDESEVSALVKPADMPEAIRLVEQLYWAKAKGAVTLHPRQTIMWPPTTGYYNGQAVRFLPGIVPETDTAGMRVYSLSNEAKNPSPSLSSSANLTDQFSQLTYSVGDEFILLWDMSSGMRLLAMMADYTHHSLRTAAPTGVATRWMARPESRILGVVGSGRHAPWQVHAICHVRPIEEIRIFSPTQVNREDLASRLAEVLPVSCTAVDSPRDAVVDADIVLTVTTANRPVIQGEWLKAGAHVNVIARGECDEATILRASVIACSWREQILQDAPPFEPVGQMLSNGTIAEERFVDLDWSMQHDTANGRGDSDVTVFLSQGVGIWDAALGRWLYDRAVAVGQGRRVDFSTRPAIKPPPRVK